MLTSRKTGSVIGSGGGGLTGILFCGTELKIGYARVSTLDKDLTAQRDALTALGVDPKWIYIDYGLARTEIGPDCAKRSPPAAAATRSS